MNNFVFNYIYYLQMIRYKMGRICAAAHANISMAYIYIYIYTYIHIFYINNGYKKYQTESHMQQCPDDNVLCCRGKLKF